MKNNMKFTRGGGANLTRAIHTRGVRCAGIIAQCAMPSVRLLQGGLRRFNLSGQGGDE